MLHQKKTLPTVSGIVDQLKNVGDRFRKGDVLAIVRGIDGVQERARVEAHFDGWIVSWNNGVRVVAVVVVVVAVCVCVCV